MTVNTKYYSEEDTKLKLITPALKASGWSENHIWMEYSLRADRFRIVPKQNRTEKITPDRNRNRPDYLLCRNVNCPLAVIEAKKAYKHAYDGIDQAIAYAKILDLLFAYASAGDKFIEYDLTTGKQRDLAMNEFPSPDELWNKWCEARGITPDRGEELSKAEYYTSNDGKVPRYYQMIAINRVVNAIIGDQRRRVLLVMATGTGKTYTAFQIVWRLRKAGAVKNVLYLADRNQLVDQTIINDFKPFEKIQTKIQDGKINSSYCIYFGLYQQLKGRDDGGKGKTFADNFRQVPPDFFDLIVVDECHRGSAKESSSWRDILEYFKPAVQLGLTATPNQKDGADNLMYFGDPVYTYSLKQGIEDGFLAPFQVVRVVLDKDQEGWEPLDGELDINGKAIPKRRYTVNDYDRTIILENRTKRVAEYVSEFLSHIGRMSKTIIFCTTQDHAARMRDEIRKCNQDLMAENPAYAVRMTGNDEDGRALYSDFVAPYTKYPVVVTTSKLLTTGADTKCVKLIVLDTPIKSMTEFKQIIGRGTRLREDAGKTFFTILDFRGASKLFEDPNFDGPAESEYTWGDSDPLPFKPDTSGKTSKASGKGAIGENSDQNSGSALSEPYTVSEHRETYEVCGVPVEIVGTAVSYLDNEGKLVKAEFKEYTRRNILKQYASDADFLHTWNGDKPKSAVLSDLEHNGVLFDQLRRQLKAPDADEFDLLRAVAFNQPIMTRQNRLKQSEAAINQCLDQYEGNPRKVLEKLRKIYLDEGVREIDDISVLRSQEFKDLGGPIKIVRAFGGKNAYMTAVRKFESALYHQA